mmetsp:Transcript_20300/g.24606  ORF Transcript_20300/g.24606 Transcript_20300/m.24606 type:complete len:101 (+) Transcript_20300:815-1117(+)
MSCTSADIVLYERNNVPAVGVASSAFVPQARFQAISHGMEDMAIIFVQHPISNCTKQEIVNKADSSYEHIVKALYSNEIYRDPKWSEGVAAEADEGECST